MRIRLTSGPSRSGLSRTYGPWKHCRRLRPTRYGLLRSPAPELHSIEDLYALVVASSKALAASHELALNSNKALVVQHELAVANGKALEALGEAYDRGQRGVDDGL